MMLAQLVLEFFNLHFSIFLQIEMIIVKIRWEITIFIYFTLNKSHIYLNIY